MDAVWFIIGKESQMPRWPEGHVAGLYRICPECGGKKDNSAKKCRKCTYDAHHPVACTVCGKEFSSYNPNPQFCSHACKSVAQRAVVDADKIVALYLAGQTQLEVADAMGITQKVVHNTLKRQGVSRRPAVARNPKKGPDNGNWKGDNATYTAYHYRVYTARGTASKCSVCGTSDQTETFDWANLTGNYPDINDYAEMCRKCHRKHDNNRSYGGRDSQYRHDVAVSAVMEMYANGMSISAIARHFGVSDPTIKNRILEGTNAVTD